MSPRTWGALCLAVLTASCLMRPPAVQPSATAGPPSSCAEQQVRRPSPDHVVVFFACTAPGADRARLYPVLRPVPPGTPPLTAALRALLAGPTPLELRQGFVATLAGLGARLQGASIDGADVATVDLAGLPREVPKALDGFHPPGIQAELGWTLFEGNLEVRAVELRLDGSCAAFWQTVAGSACRRITAEEWATR